MADGWVSIHRSITNNWIWDEKPFDRGRAWIDLLMMVNHTDAKTLIDGVLVEVKRGQRITSIRKLSDRWGWSTTKTTKFLTMLETDGMIEQKKDTKKTVVTIVNYSFYQDSEKEKVTQKRHRSNTEVTQKNTNNKENNDNNENNDIGGKPVRHKYGEYKKVLLTDEQLQKLKSEFSDWEERIQRLDDYIASTGKAYQNHFATIRNWAKDDAKKDSGKSKGKKTTFESLGGIFVNEQTRNDGLSDVDQIFLPFTVE